MICAERCLPALLAAALVLSLASCGADTGENPSGDGEVRSLVLSQEQAALDGQTLKEGEEGAVTVSRDIVYYREGQGDDYGEGSAGEEHSAEEADAHLVVTIREAGTYRVSGKLTQGQLAVDLGAEAEEDASAVVTVVLDGVEVTCTVAPAFMVYSVYECGSSDEETASPTVDTSKAGINVILADGSENHFTGSHVARIYREGTTDKLHKYDGAFYSRMSMNISGEAEGTGVLSIAADNEGLGSELHLTINGGVIDIRSQNDGINTNEDGVSVTTINGGTLRISAGMGSEGDGIDSNGHLVINGGSVYAAANGQSGDGGIDADGDILLNGGCVAALGTRNDAVSGDSRQEYMEISFAAALPAGSRVVLTDPEGDERFSFTSERDFQSLTLSSPDLAQGVDYTLTVDGVTQTYTDNQSGGIVGGAPGGMAGGPGGDRMDWMEIPEGLESWLNGAEDVPDEIRVWLEGLLERQHSQPVLPGAMAPQEGQEAPQDGDSWRGDGQAAAEASTRFTLSDGTHSFFGVTGSSQLAFTVPER